MARGIDVPDVRWVLQFDPPTNAEAFVHRCGRTARFDSSNAALEKPLKKSVLIVKCF
jgi:ATP-dependent RNA helicase DDX55/SPB4